MHWHWQTSLTVLMLLAGQVKAQSYALALHSTIAFEIQHLGVLTVEGKFTNFQGKIRRSKTRWTADVKILASSVTTGVEERDETIKGEQYLFAEKYSTIHFKGEGVEMGNKILLHGKLQIKSIASPLQITLIKNGDRLQPFTFLINRTDFKLYFGGMDALIGNEIKVFVTPILEPLAANPNEHRL